VTPAQWALGQWILDREFVAADGEAAALLGAAEQACQKLGRRLAQLITAAGYQALLTRALHLARRDFSVLEGVRVGATTDLCFDGLAALLDGVEPATMRDALTAILAGVIGLLATFIGDDLALRLVRDVWPEIPLVGSGNQQQGLEGHA
jgi:hypothetical protein